MIINSKSLFDLYIFNILNFKKIKHQKLLCLLWFKKKSIKSYE